METWGRKSHAVYVKEREGEGNYPEPEEKRQPIQTCWAPGRERETDSFKKAKGDWLFN